MISSWKSTKSLALGKYLFTLLVFSLSLCAQMKEYDIFPSRYKGGDLRGIAVLDVKAIDFKAKKGIEFKGVSALAYGKKEGLFALSDFGYLYRFDLELENKKIKALNLKEARELRGKKGRVLKKKKKRDAEGLDFSKEGLIISFEQKPRVGLFDLQGQKLHSYALPAVLKNVRNYRGKNRALEAVCLHPDLGLITAPEKALLHEDDSFHTLYGLDKRWKFKAKARMTAMEPLKDGNLLVLERRYEFWKGYEIYLSKVFIQGCKEGVCRVQTLAELKSSEGWELDNFEGLTHIREGLYLMVSDDNDNIFQKSLLMLFELKK